MNETEKIVKNFNLLGINVKLKESEQGLDISPESIVEIVRNRTNDLLNKSRSLDKSEAILLVALELAMENVKLENEFKESVSFAKETTSQILSKIGSKINIEKEMELDSGLNRVANSNVNLSCELSLQ